MNSTDLQSVWNKFSLKINGLVKVSTLQYEMVQVLGQAEVDYCCLSKTVSS